MLLTGGSAPGLAAAAGVTAFLQEQGYGYQTPFARIPLVAAAVIYDLGLGSARGLPPAARTPTRRPRRRGSNVEEGSVGAGTGATVGKLLSFEGMMKGGVGLASVELGGGRDRERSHGGQRARRRARRGGRDPRRSAARGGFVGQQGARCWR